MRYMPVTCWLLLLIVAPGLSAEKPYNEKPNSEKPNVVLIMADDVGFSDIGCYGGEIRTPHLDQLAAEGLRFTQFYNMGRCCPTRASLLTGLYPHQAGVGHMTEDYGRNAYRGNLNRTSMTIAEVLKPAGYRTYMSGKWHVTRHLHPDGPKHTWPRQRGFDKFYGTIVGAGSFFDPYTLCRDNTYITPANDSQYRPKTYYYTDAISDNAVMYLEQHQGESPTEPFFMYVAYTAAHWPLHALPDDIKSYEGQYDGGYAPIREARRKRLREMRVVDDAWKMTRQAGNWAGVENKRRETLLMQTYAAMLTSMDRGIGRIVAKLREQKQLDNTLILYLQDNGGCAEDLGWAPMDPKAKYRPFGKDDLQTKIWPPMQTRDGRVVRAGRDVLPGPADSYVPYYIAWANVSNTPFREYKHYVHEGGIATPLIAHWPSGIQDHGRWNSTPSHLIDIMATCIEVSGAAYPAKRADKTITPVEGVSLLPTFQGRRIERPKPIFWEHEGNRAVRQEQWKLVARGVRGPWELYDMRRDRTELNNLADRHQERVRRMAAQYDSWAARCGIVPFGSWRKP